ncbi:scavenger receptor class F member 2-like isoform X2 [Biomphalaria glabrata]|uniref:Scavenger receptor class F member 2-like isoform X2 n=1 Tax=Biomphalaria glabrata TaxID=6526 RepID=A0A9W3BE80_BIOGL|nr:scavenger receptor class F member 2-like isoform X2 [Biomphalaria glabrata]
MQCYEKGEDRIVFPSRDIRIQLHWSNLGINFIRGVETIEDYICTQRFKECRVNYKECSWIEEEFVGCENSFPYKTKRECLRDFRGHGNICEYRKPCRNNGNCSPITTSNHIGAFKCESAATGYYGDRCENKCPKD